MKVLNPTIPKFPIEINSMEEYINMAVRLNSFGFLWCYEGNETLLEWNPLDKDDCDNFGSAIYLCLSDKGKNLIFWSDQPY